MTFGRGIDDEENDEVDKVVVEECFQRKIQPSDQTASQAQ